MQQKKLRDKKIAPSNNQALNKEKVQKDKGGPNDKIGIRGRRIAPQDPVQRSEHTAYSNKAMAMKHVGRWRPARSARPPLTGWGEDMV